MGKGVKRSFKGKLFMGSFGKSRRHKKILKNNKTKIYLITCSTKDSNKLLQEFHNKPLSFDNELKGYRDTLFSVLKNSNYHKRKNEKDEIKNKLDFTKNYKAHEFYNGSFYEDAKAKSWTDNQTSKVYIMSALYGIIRSDDYIIDYDLMMTDTLSSNVYNNGKEFTPQEFWKGKLEKILEKIKIDNNAIIYNLLADKDYCAVIKNKNLFINPIKQPCKGDKKKCKKKTRKWFVRHINENKENDNGNSNETNNINMQKKKARIFYNSNNWIKADNTDFYAKNNDGYGERVGNDIAFGFEEWLFNPILLKLKIGFLECYRQNYFNDKVDIILYTRDRSRGWLGVAELKGVIQIKVNEIKHFKSELEKNNWQQQCYNDLENICHSDADKIEIKNRWDNHWNSTIIVQPRNHPIDLPKIGFLVNIKYEDIIYHNLNEFDPNNCWHLLIRYNIDKNNLIDEVNSNPKIPKNNLPLTNFVNQNERKNNLPQRGDFIRVLQQIILENAGNEFVDVNAGELHRRVGGYPGYNNRMPICCKVMHNARIGADEIIASPPSGQGAILTIRYYLPR